MTLADLQAAGLLVGGCMVSLWLLSLALRNSSIVDIFWGLGFVAVTALTVFRSPTPSPRAWLTLALVALWGLRLAAYLAWRNIGHGEDKRYRAMRERHGAHWWWRSLLIVFTLQGVLMLLIVGAPVFAVTADGTPLGWLDLVSAVLTLVGIGFESVGDLQLALFKRRPEHRGQVMQAGLWRYTRHPNYFGDCVVWWGLWGLSIAAGATWQTLLSPVLMTFLLTRVSGVPLLEQGMMQRPGYAEYVRRTSAFWPRPPRG